MGSRGPAKRPAEIERLHGNPGKRPVEGKLKFEKPEEIPKPPMWLGQQAKKFWKSIAPIIYDVNIFTEADISAFAGLCTAMELLYNAEKAMEARKKNGRAVLTYEDDKGNTKPIPEIAIANDARKQVLAFAKEFGLTPSSRGNISAVDNEKTENPLLAFMKKAG